CDRGGRRGGRGGGGAHTRARPPGLPVFHGLINLDDQEDLEKALRTATNAAGAFFAVPFWMSSVTPSPLRYLQEQHAVYHSQVQ
ncbi:hypothetical protein DUNSADRAFT_1030, partial [Dunaliella salina]